MRHVLTAALVLNFLLEALAASALIAGPEGLGAEGEAAANRYSMHYGFAVVAIASASLWLWPQRRVLSALTPVLGVLATFHVAVLISLLIAGDQPQGAGLHALLGLLFLFLFAKRRDLAAH